MKLEKRKAQVNLKNENENLLEHQFKNEFIKLEKYQFGEK